MTLAQQFDIPLIPCTPALTPFIFTEADRRRWAALSGISCPARISIGKYACAGDLLFTHRGLSGPAALTASLYWNKKDSLEIDLLPNVDIAAVLQARRMEGGKEHLHSILAQHLPRRLAATWCEIYNPSQPIGSYTEKKLRTIAEHLHRFVIHPLKTEGYEAAEVTRGGVDTHALSSKTMEARSTKGLYFIGEVQDVTGELGGYNLHWAWASGHAAGLHC